MRTIYHIVPRPSWRDTADPYRAESLAAEGFVHCANADQVAAVANRYFADQAELLVLVIAADRLTSPLRDEDPGVGQRFPHIYGPINRDAIVAVLPLERGADGRWAFSER